MGPEILFGLGVLVLALGIAYGFWSYKTRNKANDAISDAATREEYDHPKRYEERTKAEFKDRLQ